MAAARMTILGLMSGSSLDGIDLALVEYTLEADGEIDWNILQTHSGGYDPGLQKALAEASSLSGYDLRQLDSKLGLLFGEICGRWIDEWGIVPDYIATHGHTVFHAPKESFTLQIGSPAHIAALTGVPVIADFRSTDIARGGQGAPLAPIAEMYLFSGFGMYLNLGGIANMSAHSGDEIEAWDICPCNQLLNHLAEKKGLQYDEGGELAASGKVNPGLVEELKKVIKLPHKRPYSLANDFITVNFLPILEASDLAVEDILASAVEYIAESIARQARSAVTRLSPAPSVLVTGGGAHNGYLIDVLNLKLKADNIDLNLPQPELIDFKEAILMTLCGYLRVNGIPNTLASVTGAHEDTVNGAIYSP